MRPAGTPLPRNQPRTQAPTEIRFAFWALQSREINVVRDVIRQFEAVEPGVRVMVDEIPGKYYEKLLAMFAAGDPPDVFSINYGRLGDFVRRDLLTDLSPLLAPGGDVRSTPFIPLAIGTFDNVGSALGRPGLYALPRDWSPTNLLVYNKEAFDNADVTYPQKAWTWEQFADACRKLTVAERGGRVERYGASVCLYPYALSAWFYQGGGQILSADGSTCLLASGENVETLRFLQQLIGENVVAPSTPARDESLEQFLTGRVAMAFVTPYVLGKLRRQSGIQWGLAPPLIHKVQRTGCIPTGIAVSRKCASPREAYRLARFLVTYGAARAAQEGLCAPAWGPAIDSMGDSEAVMVVRRAMAIARPIPTSPLIPYEQLLDVLRQATERVFVVGDDPTEALQKAQERIESVLQQPHSSGRPQTRTPVEYPQQTGSG